MDDPSMIDPFSKPECPVAAGFKRPFSKCKGATPCLFP